MAKKTWIPPRFKNELHCGIVAGGRGVESCVAARARYSWLDYNVVQLAIAGNVRIYFVNG